MSGLAVGYKTEQRRDFRVPEFAHNKGTKDPVKQAEQVEAKKASFIEGCHGRPYAAQVTEVMLINADGVTHFTRENTPSIAESVMKYFSANDSSYGAVGLNLFGFEPKAMLKMLSLQLASDVANERTRMEREDAELLLQNSTVYWYGTSFCHKIETLLLPDDVPPGLPLQHALNEVLEFGVPEFVPGRDYVADCLVTAAVMRKFGFLPQGDPEDYDSWSSRYDVLVDLITD